MCLPTALVFCTPAYRTLVSVRAQRMGCLKPSSVKEQSETRSFSRYSHQGWGGATENRQEKGNLNLGVDGCLAMEQTEVL